jgi:hypothetical protein
MSECLRRVSYYVVLGLSAACVGQAPVRQDPVDADVQFSHYEVVATIDPRSGLITATAEMFFLPQTATPELRFLLHKDLELLSLESSRTHRYTEEAWQLPALADTDLHIREIILALDSAADLDEPIWLRWRYRGVLKDEHLALDPATFTEYWADLPIEAMWLPTDASLSHLFTSDSTLTLPEEYMLVGVGEMERENGTWRIQSETPGPDVPLVTSPHMVAERFRVGDGPSTVVHHVDAEPSTVRFVGESASEVAGRFAALFPAGRDIEEFRITIAPGPRRRAHSYVRRGLISLRPAVEPGQSLFGLIAHETAHLWWNNAEDPQSRHNFMNESFAEYLSWLEVARVYGIETLASRVESAEEQSRDAPPFAEWSPQNNRLLCYVKGPLLLHRLRERLGDEQFWQILRRLQEERVGTLEGMLHVLKDDVGPETADWFRHQLYGEPRQ